MVVLEALIVIIVSVFVLTVVESLLSGDNEKEKALQNLETIAEFVYYCEGYKDDLPDHIRKEFDTMEKKILENKIEG